MSADDRSFGLRTPAKNAGAARAATDLKIFVHGPGTSIDAAVEVAEASKKLLAAIAKEMDVSGIRWEITSVQFQCDGCGLLRPDKPGPDEGWTYDEGDDFCPTCSAARAAQSSGANQKDVSHD